MSTTVPSLPPPSWGERTTLLDQGLEYMFSMNLEYDLAKKCFGPTGAGWLAVLRETKAGDGFTFHALDEVLARTGDGLVCNVPFGRVTRAHDSVLVGASGVANLDGRLLLDVEGPLSIAYTGVATFRGGADRTLEAAMVPAPTPKVKVEGSAFISLRTECERPKYRWMVENQLFGYGRVEVQPGVDRCTLSFSYDIYAAG